MVVDMVRPDGSHFVTAERTPGGVAAAQKRHGGSQALVSHWRREAQQPTPYSHPMDGWELLARFTAP